MPQSFDLRTSPVMTARLVAQRHGLNVHCPCGHTGAVTPDAISRVPDTQIHDFKCRLRCRRCGRSGANDDVEIRIFVEAAPFSGQVRARGTPPQLALGR